MMLSGWAQAMAAKLACLSSMFPCIQFSSFILFRKNVRFFNQNNERCVLWYRRRGCFLHVNLMFLSHFCCTTEFTLENDVAPQIPFFGLVKNWRFLGRIVLQARTNSIVKKKKKHMSNSFFNHLSFTIGWMACILLFISSSLETLISHPPLYIK